MYLIICYFQELAESVVDVLHMYPTFGNEPINNHRDLESGAYVAEAVYLWKRGVLSADPEDFWAKGFAVEQFPDLQLLLTTTATFRGPHVDGKPELPVFATLLSGVKLWLFLPENEATKRFIIRRGWKVGEMAAYLEVCRIRYSETYWRVTGL